MTDKRGAAFFQADQVLILTGASGAILRDHEPEESRLYVLRISGQDYDLRKAGAADHERKVAVVCDAQEIAILAKRLVDMLVEGGDEGLIVAEILRDMIQRQGDDS